MSDQDHATAIEEPLNDVESEFQALISEEAVRGLPGRVFLREGPAFVISDRMQLPAFLHGGERVLVVIEATEYRELADCRSKVLAGLGPSTDEPAMSLERQIFSGHSRIDRFPVVATFLKESLGRLTLDEAVTQCQALFGEARAPSRSSVSRYWTRLREALGQERPSPSR